MKSAFNVLVSSAGRRVALARAFRAALADLGLPGDVIATDQSKLSSAFHAADRGFQVPPCIDPAFVPTLLQMCSEHSVRIVVPTIDTELAVLAQHRDDFVEAGTVVAVGSPETVAICSDKHRTHMWLTENGFPTVRQSSLESVLDDPGEWPFPLVVKPRAGSASIGVATVSTLQELSAVARHGEMVVQAIAPGQEHTVDVLTDRGGSVVCAVPRRRIEVRAGEVSKGVTVHDPSLEQLARRVCETLPGVFGALNVQIFYDRATRRHNVIEINPRFGGGFPLSHAAGADFPRWLIEEIADLPSSVHNDWRADLVMLRYDDAVYVDAGDVDIGCAESTRNA